MNTPGRGSLTPCAIWTEHCSPFPATHQCYRPAEALLVEPARPGKLIGTDSISHLRQAGHRVVSDGVSRGVVGTGTAAATGAVITGRAVFYGGDFEDDLRIGCLGGEEADESSEQDESHNCLPCLDISDKRHLPNMRRAMVVDSGRNGALGEERSKPGKSRYGKVTGLTRD